MNRTDESASITHAVDVRAFVEDALEHDGALLERGEAATEALVPEALQRALSLQESVRLTLRHDEHPRAVLCTLGTPLLEALTARLRATAVVTMEQGTESALRVEHARSLAARVVLRNAVGSVGEIRHATTTYLQVTALYVAEGDDRYEGLVQVARTVDDASVPPEGYLDRQGDEAAKGAAPAISERVLGAVQSASERGVRRALAATESSIARRMAQEEERSREYFDSLWREARAPKRKIDPKAVEARCEAIISERDAKLRELPARYALRVRSSWVAVRVHTAASVRVELRARRRKNEGTLVLRLSAGAGALDTLGCQSCFEGAAKPALCDARLHVLCEQCVPQAQGRWDCPVCAMLG